MLKHILIVILSLFFFETLSKNIFLYECQVTEELENEKPAKKRNYKKNTLPIYIDKENSWMNDLLFSEWLKKNVNNLDKIEKQLAENNKKIIFKFEKFQSKNKKIIDENYNIKLEKFGGYFEFKKFYRDYEGVVYFTSEVRGYCQ